MNTQTPDYTIVEGWMYRDAYVEIHRFEGSRCPLFRAHWRWDGEAQDHSADAATTSQTLAGADARRAIDRHVDGTTDHFALADRLAEEEAGERLCGERFE